MCAPRVLFRQKQVNHARNIWDRAVTIMPRVNTFWQKYTYMEEIIGNVVNARQIFERWMQWHPDEQAWQAYINFEFRYQVRSVPTSYRGVAIGDRRACATYCVSTCLLVYVSVCLALRHS